MSMSNAIKDFATQFTFQAKIENETQYTPKKKFIVVGMGGSHLAADLIKIWDPSLTLFIHHDYGVPKLSEQELKQRTVILSSYSGNTEEVLEAYQEAADKKLSRIVIAVGGKLIDYAKRDNVPFVQLPDTGIQPRSALGFSLLALLKVMGQEKAIKAAKQLANSLKPTEFEKEGRELAHQLQGYIPVIYASLTNLPIAYNWKIKLNETGKIPAFYNVFPELNHNEMTGFDVADTTRSLSKKFCFLLLKDRGDHPKIQQRMDVLSTLYQQRSLKVITIPLQNSNNQFRMIFASLVLADWTAHYTAQNYGLDSEQVPMVEEFKRLIA